MEMWNCGNMKVCKYENGRVSRLVSRVLMILGICIFAHCAAFAGNALNPDALELAPLPMPVQLKADIDSPVPFDARTTVTVECPDATAAAWLAAHFAAWYADAAPLMAKNKNMESQPHLLTHGRNDDARPHATNWFEKSAIAIPFARMRDGISSERTSHTQIPGPSA